MVVVVFSVPWYTHVKNVCKVSKCMEKTGQYKDFFKFCFGVNETSWCCFCHSFAMFLNYLVVS